MTRRNVRISITMVALVLGRSTLATCQTEEIAVGSKKFTESVILGEIVALLATSRGYEVTHRRELGGTQFVWRALVRGELDAYVDYTGTLREETFADRDLTSDEALPQEVARFGVRMSSSLGFNNTYALGMKEELAESLNVRTITDLRNHPDLRFGFTNEFMVRGDGWPSLNARYRFPQQTVRGLDHDLSYRGLETNDIHVLDVYSTDAEIAYYKLRVLQDDLKHFPAYSAVLLYRADLEQRAPELLTAWRSLEGTITEDQMVRMNAMVKLEGMSEGEVAAAFLEEALAIEALVVTDTWVDRLVQHTLEHLFLVSVSLAAAILLAIPLGTAAFVWPRLGKIVLWVVGVIQTIPSLALLVFMIPLLGIGAQPAIVALFLYSLLPIVRNTHAGLGNIPGDVRESAEALGLPRRARLRLVELPMASPSILAGIKTSAVINIGTATLGALIGAGGYGQPILTGIRLDNVGLILQGAVPAAVLAILVQGLFDLGERVAVPKGLRLQRE